MESILQQGIGETVTNNYLSYGREVNTRRSVANLDGLKISHRRVLLAAEQMNGGKLVNTSKLVGDTIGNYHPHGLESISGLVSSFVRKGLLFGYGNHGSDGISPDGPAAIRYTKSGMMPGLRDYFFKLYDYANLVEGEVDGTIEPETLIVPIPVALLIGGGGIGLGGVTAMYPAFTYESLIDAFYSNDPTKLKSRYNTIIDADYKSLWTEGTGRISYAMDVRTEYSKDDQCNVTVIEGETGGLVPSLGVFKELVEQGRVAIRDESSTKLRVVVYRTLGTRAISDEEVYQKCKEVSQRTISYRLMVSLGSKVKILGIKDWLSITMSIYEKSFNKWKNDSIARYRRLIEEYTWLPKVGELLLQNKTNKDIIDELGIQTAIFHRILQKPINMLRNRDFSAKITEFSNKIADLEKLNAKAEVLHYKQVFKKD